MVAVKAGFNFASLPIIREFHPWVSDKHTHGVYLPINESMTYENVFLPYPLIFEFIERSSHRMIMNVCGCRVAYGCLDEHRQGERLVQKRHLGHCALRSSVGCARS